MNRTENTSDVETPLTVGVGASAGGLETFQKFLSALGENPGLAIVVVQHQDPRSESFSPELIASGTSLDVVEITDGQNLRANTVHLCPPQSLLTMRGNELTIADSDRDKPVASIDHFFCSIADVRKEHGIGVVLAGTGSDGTLGLKAIRDAGGSTFAQDAKSAQYVATPRSATTGVADHRMPPTEIATELLRYAVRQAKESSSAAIIHQDRETIVTQLERELETTRRRLDSTLQGVEAANKELKASNEELLLMNEELQSANEELETSREEIRANRDAVARAKDDLENLLRSTQIATVFLDDQLRIRSFTPVIDEIYNLLPTDVGRSLQQFVPLVLKMPPLPEPTSLEDGVPVEHTIVAESGKSFIRRVLPYRSYTGERDGIVVTFTDVTELKNALREVADSQQQLTSLISSTAEGIYGIDLQGYCTFANEACLRLLGYESKDQLLGKQMHELVHYKRMDGADYPNEACPIYGAYREKTRVHVDDEVFWRADGSSFDVEYWSYPEQRDGETVGCVVTFLDVTERRTWQRELVEREAHLRRVIDGTLNFIAVLDSKGKMLEVNAPALKATGLSRREVLGKPFWETAWWVFDSVVRQEMRSLVQQAAQGRIVRKDTNYAVENGDHRPVDVMLNPICDSDGKVEYIVASGVDIFDREETKRSLAVAKSRLDFSMNASGMGAWSWDMSANNVVADDNLKLLFGFSKDEVPDTEAFMRRIDEADRERVADAVNDAIATGGTFHEEYQVHRPNGEHRWMRARGRAAEATDGNVEDFFGVVIDITERKQREIDLAEREAHLRRVINNQLGLVGVIDRNGVLLEVDDRSLEIAQTRREDVIGKPFADAPWWNYDPVVADKMRDAMRQALTGQVVRYDVSLFAHGDDGVAIDFMIAPVFDDDGNVEYLIPSGVDIRQRKKIEQQQFAVATRLEVIFNTAVDGIITIDRRGIINSVNVAASKIFGYEISEMVGHNVSMLMPEPYHSEHDGYLAKYEETGQQNIIGNQRELAGIRKDGTVFPLDIAVSETTLPDEHSYVGMVRDISERIENEQALKDSSRRMRMALRAGRMAAWEWTPAKSYWTDEVYDLLGISSDQEASSELFFSLVHPEDADDLRQHWKQAIEVTDTYDTEFRIILPNGEIRWIIGLGEVVRSKSGKVIRMYGMNWDSTHDHEQAEALRESERRAKAASASKSEFLANMSHEIRTPMTAILGYADLLRDYIENDEARQHLDTIRRNGDYLLEIINDILDLSKIEAGKLEVDREVFDPSHVMEDVRSIMEVRAREGGLTLKVEYDGEIPQVIHSDPKRVKQILINLVGNAIKFTHEGRVRIRVRFDASRSQLQIDIVDTGIGMTDEQHARLFRPFSQGDASVTRDFGGTGLGLAISQRLARMLGGEITAGSTPKVGSTFTVTIATGELSGVAMIDHSNDNEKIHRRGNTESASPRLDCHVLVVDDRVDIRFLSRRLLTKAGATVEECEDGLLAVEFVRTSMRDGQLPDLILLDMQMPNLDGYATAKQLRELGYTGPIIALTADAMQGDMSQCLEAGCNDYLSKPIDSARFLAVVAALTK